MKKDTCFTVDEHRLKATLFYPDKMNPRNPGVLFIHGWTSSEENYARRAKPLAECGGICLTFGCHPESCVTTSCETRLL